MDASPMQRSGSPAATRRRPEPGVMALPLALLVAWAVALNPLAGLQADAARVAAQLMVPLAIAGQPDVSSHRRTWSFDLPPQALGNVQVDLASVRPAARPLLQRLAGLVSFDDHVAQCLAPAVSCSTSGSGLDDRWGIHLDARTTSFTYPSNRFLVYHEIGHAVWGLLLRPEGGRAFAQAVSRALRGRPCMNDQGRPCAVLPEMFADEFARYAGGFRASMSYYCTPPLLDAVAFRAVLHAGGQ